MNKFRSTRFCISNVEYLLDSRLGQCREKSVSFFVKRKYLQRVFVCFDFPTKTGWMRQSKRKQNICVWNAVHVMERVHQTSIKNVKILITVNCLILIFR